MWQGRRCSSSQSSRPVQTMQWTLPARSVRANRVSIYSRSTPSSAPPARMATTALQALCASPAQTERSRLWTRPRADVLAACETPQLSLKARLSVYVGRASHFRPHLCSALHARRTRTAQTSIHPSPTSFSPDVFCVRGGRFLAAVRVGAPHAPLGSFVSAILLSAARTALLACTPRMRHPTRASTVPSPVAV